jgi:hypothetical protein
MRVVSPEKLGNMSLTCRDWAVSSTPPTCQARGILGLEWGQTRAVIFCGLQGTAVSKTLLCVTSQSVNISSVFVVPYQQPSHGS